MAEYRTAVPPSLPRRRYRSVEAIAHSAVGDGMAARFAGNFDGAPIAGTGIGARFARHGLEAGYPHGDSAVIGVRVCDGDE